MKLVTPSRKAILVLLGILCLICFTLISLGARESYYSFSWNRGGTLQWRPQNVVPSGRDDFPVKIPDRLALFELADPEAEELYYSYIQTLQVLCQKIVRVGSIFDGGKELCIDEPYKPKIPCLVYSFGINWKWDFDEDMVTLFGCEVFSFDPSMMNETDFFKRGPNITFHKIGLWNRHTIDDKGWHLMTLKQIRQKLGHENKVIDVLKIDIDWSEWTALPEVIASGELRTVKQMLIEFHNNDNKETLQVFRMLYESGFRIFMKEKNILGCLYKVPWSIRERPDCVEISFIHV